MTNRRRGIFVGLILALVGTASLAVAVAAYIHRLPDPDTADRRGLFRWLVECDLRRQPHDLQLVVMRRVEEELLAGIDFREIAVLLNDGQRQRLLENADLLARCWFRRAADCFFAEPNDRRSLVLGRQIEQIQRLGIMDQLTALERGWDSQEPRIGGQASGKQADAVGNSSAATIASQIKRIEHWLAETQPPERDRLSQYFTALRNRLLMDTVRQWDGVGKWLPNW